MAKFKVKTPEEIEKASKIVAMEIAKVSWMDSEGAVWANITEASEQIAASCSKTFNVNGDTDRILSDISIKKRIVSTAEVLGMREAGILANKSPEEGLVGVLHIRVLDIPDQFYTAVADGVFRMRSAPAGRDPIVKLPVCNLPPETDEERAGVLETIRSQAPTLRVIDGAAIEPANAAVSPSMALSVVPTPSVIGLTQEELLDIDEKNAALNRLYDDMRELERNRLVLISEKTEAYLADLEVINAKTDNDRKNLFKRIDQLDRAIRAKYAKSGVAIAAAKAS